MTDDHDNTDDTDADADPARIDPEMPDTKTVTLDVGDRDDLGPLIGWAKLFTDADSNSAAVWEALRRWVWIQSDFEGDVDPETVPPTEKGQERVPASRAAELKINSTRLRTMGDYAVGMELAVYRDYFNNKAESRDSPYRRVAENLAEAQQILEVLENHRAKVPAADDDASEQDDTPDTE